MKKKLLLLLLAMISLLILLWLADFNEVYQAIKEIRLQYIVIGCLLQLITILVISLQWYQIGKRAGVKVNYLRFLHMNMVGSFVESITPSVKAGGEAAKVYILHKKEGIDLGRATAIVGFQKTVSFIAFVIINLFSIIWFFLKVDSNIIPRNILIISFLSMVFIMIIAILALLYPQRILEAIYKLSWKRLDYRSSKGLENFKTTIKDMLSNRTHFMNQLTLSIFIWAFFAFKAIFLSSCLQLDISPAAVAVATYLTYMVAMLPLLPGGLGSFEGSMLLFLSAFGITTGGAMAFALALRFVTFWFVVILGGFYIGIHSFIEFIKGKSYIYKELNQLK